MQIFLKLLVYIASVWVSSKYAAGYWVVGPVFGAAVIASQWPQTKTNLKRAAVFIATSTLVYALVYHLSNLKWGKSSSGFVEYFLGPFPIAIIVGSILLPWAHALILKRSSATAWRMAFSLSASFYAVSLLAYFNQERGIGPSISWLLPMIAIWQGVYLLLSETP